MAAKYRYYLDFGSGDVEIIPDKDVIYLWKKEGEYKGFMRQSIDKLTFSKDFDNQGTFTNLVPFNTLWEWYFDLTKHTTKISLTVYKNAVLDFETSFFVQNGVIDINNGVYTIKPITDDAYAVLLSVIENEVDIITNLGTRYIAQYTYTTVTQSEDNGSSTEAPDYPASPSSWVLEPGGGSTTWVREQSQLDLGTVLGVTPIKIGNYWYYAIDTSGAGYDEEYNFPNCYYLTDSIQLILTTILDGTAYSAMTLKSNFFNDVTNYVTGETNKLMNTLIEQRSDTKDPDATNEATVGVVSLKVMMEELYKMFNVSWYIDGDGYFRIEHEKYFYSGLSVAGTKIVGIDLTDITKYYTEEANKYYIENTQNYEGVVADKIKSETIKLPDEETLDFRADLNYIEYDVLQEITIKKEHNVTVFSTDVGKAINNPDGLLDDDFFMFNCEPESGGILQIIARPSDTTGDAVDVINTAFSPKWLLNDYYTYGRPDKSGTLVVNRDLPGTWEVDGSKPIYIQKDVVFLLNDNDTIDINKYIRTYLIKSDGVNYDNDGNIEKIEHDLNTDFVKVTLGYEL